MPTQQAELLIIALERGSDWLPALEARHSLAPDIVAFIQEEDEGLEQFAQRVSAQVRALKSRASQLRRAVFCTNGPSRDYLDARANIALALLAGVAAHEHGELLLTGNESMFAEERVELLALAGALIARDGPSPGITVSFGRPEFEMPAPRDSGVYTVPGGSVWGPAKTMG